MNNFILYVNERKEDRKKSFHSFFFLSLSVFMKVLSAREEKFFCSYANNEKLRGGGRLKLTYALQIFIVVVLTIDTFIAVKLLNKFSQKWSLIIFVNKTRNSFSAHSLLQTFYSSY